MNALQLVPSRRYRIVPVPGLLSTGLHCARFEVCWPGTLRAYRRLAALCLLALALGVIAAA